MPLGQRIAHVPPEGSRRVLDLGGELLVGAGDVVPKGEVVAVRCSFGSPSGPGGPHTRALGLQRRSHEDVGRGP